MVFGSVARGEALADSDVDVAVLGGEFWDQLKLAADVGAGMGREAHAVDLSRAGETLRYHVARDGVLLFAAEPSAWPRFRAEAVLRYLDFEPVLNICAEGARRRLRAEARGG